MLPDIIKLDDQQIHLWLVSLNDPGATSDHRNCLSADEMGRAEKFVFDVDRDRFIRSRTALREILARYTDRSPTELVFQQNEHGKPELLSPELRGLRFNLSHTKEIAVIAVAMNRNLGVDIVEPGRTPEWSAIAKRSFSNTEQKSLFALPEASREQAFYRTWCQKEAYTKGIGEGFRYGFQNFTMEVQPDKTPAVLFDDISSEQVHRWRLSEVSLASTDIVMIADDGKTAPLIQQHNF